MSKILKEMMEKRLEAFERQAREQEKMLEFAERQRINVTKHRIKLEEQKKLAEELKKNLPLLDGD